MTTPAERHLQKVAVKHVRSTGLKRARFLSAVRATLPSGVNEREAVVLVGRVCAVKPGNFSISTAPPPDGDPIGWIRLPTIDKTRTVDANARLAQVLNRTVLNGLAGTKP